MHTCMFICVCTYKYMYIYKQELLRAQVHAEQQAEEKKREEEDLMTNLLTSKEAMKVCIILLLRFLSFLFGWF
jgi:hypothetical protein